MIFTDIRLQNFRSYSEQSFDLGAGVNIVVGPNAAGKTNLLEAMMLSSVGKSYKSNDKILISHLKDWSRIDTHTTNNQSRSVKISSINETKAEKIFEIDEKKYKKLTVENRQPIVLFEPSDLSLFTGEPSVRREYIDNFADQIIVGHGALVNRLKRTIQQRNSLLKQHNINQQLLFTWNLRMCEISSQVVANRKKVIDIFQNKISDTYSSVAGKKSKLKLSYESKIPLDNYSTCLLKELENNLELDKIRGFTSRGPHRDEIVPFIDDIDFASTVSRGENRTFLLSLKIIELETLFEVLAIKPLLLLDDVFSELDGARRRHLTNHLKDTQTIITTTDADAVMKSFSESTSVIPIEKTNFNL